MLSGLLEPRYIDMVFEILDDLQHGEGKTIVMVEQNAKKGLEFADLGYVLVSGQLANAGGGDEPLQDPDVGRLFLGGEGQGCSKFPCALSQSSVCGGQAIGDQPGVKLG